MTQPITGRKLFTTFCISICFNSVSFSQEKTVGIFDADSGFGSNSSKKGHAVYNAEKQEYQLAGSEEFHYLRKKIKGNFILQATGEFSDRGIEHLKAGWMVRPSLDAGSTHVSAVVNGKDLSSLQYTQPAGTGVAEKKSQITLPDIIQLERRGNKFIMSVAKFGDPFQTVETDEVDLDEDVYVGLFLQSTNKDSLVAANFYNVRVIIPAKENFNAYRDYIGSFIELMDVETGKRELVYTSPKSLQAPNWTPDNKSLIYNSEGLIYKFDLKTKTPTVLNTDFAKENNNDHVISFDGKMLGLSSASADPKYGSIIYTVPITGGKPKQITSVGPSYLHGWSPDGKWLTYTGERNGEFDIYKIPSTGGEEIRLTTAKGLDDGSEYSPDGKYIYFNSVRSGKMQIWRMKPNGTDQEQLTDDEYNNWFPHISPDGKHLVMLSFMKDVDPSDHPFYKHVYLRLMPVDGGKPKVIAYLYGGQGSINTPSWSPDSKKVAFVSNSDLSEM